MKLFFIDFSKGAVELKIDEFAVYLKSIVLYGLFIIDVVQIDVVVLFITVLSDCFFPVFLHDFGIAGLSIVAY